VQACDGNPSEPSQALSVVRRQKSGVRQSNWTCFYFQIVFLPVSLLYSSSFMQKTGSLARSISKSTSNKKSVEKEEFWPAANESPWKTGRGGSFQDSFHTLDGNQALLHRAWLEIAPMWNLGQTDAERLRVQCSSADDTSLLEISNHTCPSS
jgi:hypothetical protein